MRRFAQQLSWAADGSVSGFAIDAAVSERLAFIRRTYMTLLVQLCAVAGVATLMTRVVPSGYYGILAIAALLVAIFVGPRLLAPGQSRATHIGGAALFVGAYGLFCAPLALFVPGALLLKAFIVTCCVFGGLTAYVFVTKKDFSFLGGFLSAALFLLIGIMIISLFFGGFGGVGSLVLSGLVVLVISGFVLYETSAIMRSYPTDMHIPAATSLMASFVVLFQYILHLLMAAQE